MSDDPLWEWCTQYMLEGEARLVRHLLERRFGALPVWADQQLTRATQEDLMRWGQGVLAAKLSLEELLRT